MLPLLRSFCPLNIGNKLLYCILKFLRNGLFSFSFIFHVDLPGLMIWVQKIFPYLQSIYAAFANVRKNKNRNTVTCVWIELNRVIRLLRIHWSNFYAFNWRKNLTFFFFGGGGGADIYSFTCGAELYWVASCFRINNKLWYLTSI